MLSASGDFVTTLSGLGGLLSGLGELFVAMGAIIGLVVRGRRAAKKEREKAEEAATLAAQETKKTMEARLDKQHEEQIRQLNDQISSLQKMVNQLLARTLENKETDHDIK